jgi:hypothetical protein
MVDVQAELEAYRRRVFHMGQCIAALRIETRTGLKHSRGSILQMVRVAYGIKARSKVAALEALEALYLEETGQAFGFRNSEVSS